MIRSICLCYFLPDCYTQFIFSLLFLPASFCLLHFPPPISIFAKTFPSTVKIDFRNRDFATHESQDIAARESSLRSAPLALSHFPTLADNPPISNFSSRNNRPNIGHVKRQQDQLFRNRNGNRNHDRNHSDIHFNNEMFSHSNPTTAVGEGREEFQQFLSFKY